MSGKYNPGFPQTFAKHIGKLSNNMSNRRDGKRILEWTFEVPNRKSPVSVEISVITEQGGGLAFVARAPELVPEVRGTDIQALYEAVDARLQASVCDLSGIAWEEWFEVRVTGSGSDFQPDMQYAALGADLHIHISRLARGLNPLTGRWVTVNTNGVMVDFPQPTRFVQEDTGLFAERPVERAYLPATAENEAALRDILNRMVHLRQRLVDLLTHEDIQANLRDLANRLPMLPSPSVQGDNR